jgi:hypothetical protein
MAKKKKAYQRFEELTRQATAPTPAEAELDRGANVGRSSGATGMESAPAEALPIRLSREVRQALEERVAADDTTPSEIVQEALRRYLELPR